MQPKTSLSVSDGCGHPVLSVKSSVAEHSLQNGHDIHYRDTEVLSTTVHYHARLQREAIEIFKHHNSFNRKEEIERVNKAWIPVLKNGNVKPAAKQRLAPVTDSQSAACSGSSADRYGLRRERAQRSLYIPVADQRSLSLSLTVGGRGPLKNAHRSCR